MIFKKIGKGLRKFLFPSALLFLIVNIFLLGFLHLFTFLYVPPKVEKIEKIIEIPEKTTLREASEILEAEGLIRDREPFVLMARLMGVDREIKAGEYALNTWMRPLEILRILIEGKVMVYEVRIPEGQTASQIGKLLAENGLVNYDTFMALVNDQGFVKFLGIDAPSLEGYLFPETYYFTKKDWTYDIIKKMVQNFKRTFNSEFEERASELKMTQREVVALASIIEKEAGVDTERPLIAAVFHNRLKKKIPLQSDPTVIYGLKNFSGNLTREHLRIRTPYNTYVIKGLPPGPIANPGRKSIYAALFPAKVDFLYFVSKNDGTHYFSKDLPEHNQAVYKYQKNKKNRRKARAS